MAPDDPLGTDYVAHFVIQAAHDDPTLAQMLKGYRFSTQTRQDPQTLTGAVVLHFSSGSVEP